MNTLTFIISLIVLFVITAIVGKLIGRIERSNNRKK